MNQAASTALRVALISGGNSNEASVSRTSATAVLSALAVHYTQVQNFELDNALIQNLTAFKPDVVFPVLHGPPGEDGTIQGLLETMQLAYVGSGVQASALAMDKIAAKGLFREAELPLADHVSAHISNGIKQAVDRVMAVLGANVVVKPARQGSALGISLVNDIQELQKAVSKAFSYDDQVLIEQRINGREMTVGILQDQGQAKAFPVIEITTPENSWYDFEHRYTAGLSEHIMPANISSEISASLQKIAIKAHICLGCRDLSRADFLLTDDDKCILLEVNTLPGMTPTSLYPDGARGFGLTFDELVKLLAEQAAARP